MVAFLICCEGPCRPGLESGRRLVLKVVPRGMARPCVEARTGATSGSAPRVGEKPREGEPREEAENSEPGF